MKILIISGFLGAGKTTFIKEIIKATNREFVIFENEFGSLSIDGDILEKENEKNENKVEIWESSNGCVCCSTKGDFVSSLLTIDNTLNPDFLIVEPSGIASLTNVVNNIKNLNYERLQILSPLTIVDVNTYFKYKQKYKDVFLDQIKSSLNIQFSKIDNFSKEELEFIENDIKKINPNAKIFVDDYKKYGEDYWNNLFDNELKGEMDKEVLKYSNMRNLSYENAKCCDIIELINFLELVVRKKYGDIIRGKGIFETIDYYMRFDLVDSQYAISFIEKDNKVQKNNIVLIGNDINKESLKEKLDKMKNQ